MRQLYECTEEGFFLGNYYKLGARAKWLPAQVVADAHRWRLVKAEPAAAPPVAASPVKPARSRKTSA